MPGPLNPKHSHLLVAGQIFCGSYCAVPEKKTYLPHGRSLAIPKTKGALKVKSLEAKYEAKLEVLGGRRDAKQKYLLWGEYGYFTLKSSALCKHPCKAP